MKKQNDTGMERGRIFAAMIQSPSDSNVVPSHSFIYLLVYFSSIMLKLNDKTIRLKF